MYICTLVSRYSQLNLKNLTKKIIFLTYNIIKSYNIEYY